MTAPWKEVGGAAPKFPRDPAAPPLDKRRRIGERLGPFGSAITMNASDLWSRYRKHLSAVPAIGLTLAGSRMKFDDPFPARMRPAMQKAYADMDALEKGAIANPDEKRMVGHYWLRDA